MVVSLKCRRLLALRRGEHLHAIDPEHSPVVAVADERPRTRRAFLHIELARCIRRRVRHVAIGTLRITVLREEVRLVVRDGATRSAADLLVEARRDTLRVAPVIAEFARSEHGAAVRRNVNCGGCAFAERDLLHA